jgi:hypothetical protein
MAARYPGARVVAGQLIRGYAEAVKRFEGAVRKQEPDPSFFALFESLNWAVAVDDFVREVWVPNGKPLNWKWRSFMGGEELAELLNGSRYARNLVHHHWADALRRDDSGFRFPMRFPLVFYSWIWRDADQLPDPRDADKPHVEAQRAAYDKRLAGQRADDTLLAIGEAFERVGTLLDPPRPASPPAA